MTQIHSTQFADPLRRGRAAQHNSWDVGRESFSERTESPKAVTEFNLDKAVPIELRHVSPPRALMIPNQS